MTPVHILWEDGSLAGLVEGFTPRAQQVEMAEAVAGALEEGRSLICEAGTGTGKTFAYLVPALMSGLKVIISTGTRHLQDQLYLRDLPVVRQALRIPVNVVLLKGRGNYLCLYRLALAERQGAELSRRALAQVVEIRRWSQGTRTGDLAEFASLPEESPLRGLVTSTTENCLGQSCEFYEDCFVFKARRAAAEADVVIVNHYLYLADMNLRELGHGELLPGAGAVIFDEAHLLPELASRFFSHSLSSHQWLELARDARLAYREEAADLPQLPAALEGLEKAVRDFRLAVGDDNTSRPWREVMAREDVAEPLATFVASAREVHEMLEAFADRGRLLDQCSRRLGELLALLAEFQQMRAGDFIEWLEIRGRGFLLHRTPLEIADSFQARMAERDCPAVYTSATLSVNGDFHHFASQLGLHAEQAVSWSSPFDYRRQALLYMPADLPDPREEGYTEAVVRAALPVLELTGGRAFFLFTSHRALQRAVPAIKGSLSFPVLVQGDAPRTELLERFRRSGQAVLLGTGSFWEGVDVRGRALSCVIIDKLPFASPDDPVLQARLVRMEEQGRSPFMEYQLPEAVISLRQGIGRLIRDERDYGVLMICDPRLLSRSYGRIFLASLPDMVVTHSLDAVGRFLNLHESSAAGAAAE